MISLLLLLLIPIVGSLIIIICSKKYSKLIILLTSIIEFLQVLYIIKQIKIINDFNLFNNIGIDGISACMILMSVSLFLLIIISTYKFDNYNKIIYSGSLFSLCGIIGVYLSLNAFLFYLFWELSLLPIYIILLSIAKKYHHDNIIKNFLRYSMLSSITMITIILYIYSQLDTKSFIISELYSFKYNLNSQILIFIAFFISFAIKIPLFPFHKWQPELYNISPSIISMLLAAIMSKMGVYGIIRFILPINNELITQYSIYIIIFIILGMIYASIMACYQNNIKIMIGYSSIAHSSLLIISIFTKNIIAVQGAILQMFNHGLIIIGLFMIVNIVSCAYKTTYINKFSGIIEKYPLLELFILSVILSSVAFPCTGSFISEIIIFYSIINYNICIGILVSIIVILTTIYMMNLYKSMLGINSVKINGNYKIKTSEIIAILTTIVLIFLMNVLSRYIMNLSYYSLSILLNY